MEKQILFSKTIDNLLAIEIAKGPGIAQATLVIHNDANIDREIRQRPHHTGMRTTNVPDTAQFLFNAIMDHLEDKGLRCGDIKRTNLPKLPPDETDFSAEATIETGGMPDDQLRPMLEEAVAAAEAAMAAARFRRKAGNWSDRKGGRAAGL